MAFWINIHGCHPYPRNSHLSTKSDKKPIAIVRDCSKPISVSTSRNLELNACFTKSSSGNALGIWICGCSLFYKRELWASKLAGAHCSTKSLKISGCKR